MKGTKDFMLVFRMEPTIEQPKISAKEFWGKMNVSPLKSICSIKYVNRLFFLLIISIFSTNILVAQKIEWIPFNWSGYQTKTKYFDKSAIMIHVKIDNLPYRFKMQFDLGADKTVVYGKTFQSYKKEFEQFETKLDTTNKFWYNNKEYPSYPNVKLTLGEKVFKNIQLGKYTDFGSVFNPDTLKKDETIIIGTIGADLFKDKYLIIDYPNSRIAVVSKLPKEFSNVVFVKTKKLDDGRFYVPLEIGGKTEYVLFDTGTAMFPLITSENNAIAISNDVIKDSIEVSTWGKYYFVYGNQINKPVTLANKTLTNGLVYYDKVKTFDNWFEVNNFWGILGNAFFIKNIVVIDYKNYSIAVK